MWLCRYVWSGLIRDTATVTLLLSQAVKNETFMSVFDLIS
jgi:hypothetical protein